MQVTSLLFCSTIVRKHISEQHSFAPIYGTISGTPFQSSPIEKKKEKLSLLSRVWAVFFTSVCRVSCRVYSKTLCVTNSKLILILTFFALVPALLQAQQTGPDLSEMTETSIDAVHFVGNARFSSEELADAVSSRPTDRSWTRQIFEYYYNGFSNNQFSPPPLLSNLKNAISLIPDGLRYFSPATAQGDADIIEELYNQHGYHETKATYDFSRDSVSKKFILTFSITEGKPYTIRAIDYRGLNNLPPDVAALVEEQKNVKIDAVFEESALNHESAAIEDVLKNNGYYFASYSATKPTVYSDTTSKTDSIFTEFIPGERIKFGSISIERQLNGQSAITDNLVRELSELHEGEWYSRKKVVGTINALYQLGVYDFVSIDTIGRQTMPDSVTQRFNMKIYTRYKEQQEFGVSPFLNRTANDNLTNFGGETLYSHRNAFGAAQNFNVFIRYIWNDFQISLADGFSSTSSEIQTGMSLVQPVMLSFDDIRISGSGQAIFSRKFAIPQVFVNTFSLRLSAPMTFPPWTFLGLASALPDLNVEVQSVENGNLIPATDTTSIQRGIVEPLRVLNRFTGRTFRLTGVVMGLNLIGDTRNDLFSPASGHLLTIGPEFALGPLAFYQKFQASYLHFQPLTPRTVFAYKIRLGHIFARNGDYIPVERLFFAGGANSVRSYGARQLFDPLVTKHLPDSLKQMENIGILTGSKSLIEGSFEVRWMFQRPASISSFIASQIERMGLTFFIDYGSTYNSSSQSPSFAEVIENIAVGFGFGFRYATPVGPFRIDLATKLYDPTSPDRTFITQRNIFDDMQLHIGLGHAF